MRWKLSNFHLFVYRVLELQEIFEILKALLSLHWGSQGEDRRICFTGYYDINTKNISTTKNQREAIFSS